MENYPYHHYLFFDINPELFRQPANGAARMGTELLHYLSPESLASAGVQVDTYATLGFKARTTFMVWCRSSSPTATQNMLRDLNHLGIGKWLILRKSLFGIIRPSQYSRPGQTSAQAIQPNDPRQPFLIIYPFIKTAKWYLLPATKRREMMGSHIKIGIGHTEIKQCLLYSTGVDDNEFVVSYETPTLEAFQDLVVELRGTAGRAYTAVDTPVYTCVHKPLKELLEWL